MSRRSAPEEDPDDAPLFAFPPHNGRRTSIAAAASILPNVGSDRRKVYDAIASSPIGLTRDGAQVMTGLSHQNASARCWELLGNGGHAKLIYETGELRATRSGRKAEVLRPTASAATGRETSAP